MIENKPSFKSIEAWGQMPYFMTWRIVTRDIYNIKFQFRENLSMRMKQL